MSPSVETAEDRWAPKTSPRWAGHVFKA